jgi:hypothetical protein
MSRASIKRIKQIKRQASQPRPATKTKDLDA